MFAYHLGLQVGPGAFPAASSVAFLGRRGYLGVDGFFILSGLVLAFGNAEGVGGWRGLRRFWGRRLARLYPVHLALLATLGALVLGAALAGVAPRDPGRFGAGEFVRHALLLHGWGLSDRWAWNYPSWSISTEWAGYLAFPAVWALVRALPRGAAALLPPLCLLLLREADRGGAVGLNLTYHGAFGRYAPEFVAGLAAARATASGRWPRGGDALLGVLVGALAMLLPVALAVAPDWAVVAVMGGLLWALFARGLAGRVVLARLAPLRWLGELSYPFYMCFALSELLLASVWRASEATPAETPARYVLAATALTLALALAVSRLVEQPAARWLRPAVPPPTVSPSPSSL